MEWGSRARSAAPLHRAALPVTGAAAPAACPEPRESAQRRQDAGCSMSIHLRRQPARVDAVVLGYGTWHLVLPGQVVLRTCVMTYFRLPDARDTSTLRQGNQAAVALRQNSWLQRCSPRKTIMPPAANGQPSAATSTDPSCAAPVWCSLTLPSALLCCAWLHCCCAAASPARKVIHVVNDEVLQVVAGAVQPIHVPTQRLRSSKQRGGAALL